eukprot:3076914-Rhodomonas_salina.1
MVLDTVADVDIDRLVAATRPHLPSAPPCPRVQYIRQLRRLTTVPLSCVGTHRLPIPKTVRTRVSGVGFCCTVHHHRRSCTRVEIGCAPDADDRLDVGGVVLEDVEQVLRPS